MANNQLANESNQPQAAPEEKSLDGLRGRLEKRSGESAENRRILAENLEEQKELYQSLDGLVLSFIEAYRETEDKIAQKKQETEARLKAEYECNDEIVDIMHSIHLHKKNTNLENLPKS